jgi:hypothetical protein
VCVGAALQVVANVTESIKAACAARGVSCEVRRTHDAAAVWSDDGIVQVMRRLEPGDDDHDG